MAAIGEFGMRGWNFETGRSFNVYITARMHSSHEMAKVLLIKQVFYDEIILPSSFLVSEENPPAFSTSRQYFSCF